MRLIIQKSNGYPNLRMSKEEALSLVAQLVDSIQKSTRFNQFVITDSPLTMIHDDDSQSPSMLLLTLVPEGRD